MHIGTLCAMNIYKLCLCSLSWCIIIYIVYAPKNGASNMQCYGECIISCLYVQRQVVPGHKKIDEKQRQSEDKTRQDKDTRQDVWQAIVSDVIWFCAPWHSAASPGRAYVCTYIVFDIDMCKVFVNLPGRCQLPVSQQSHTRTDDTTKTHKKHKTHIPMGRMQSFMQPARADVSAVFFASGVITTYWVSTKYNFRVPIAGWPCSKIKLESLHKSRITYFTPYFVHGKDSVPCGYVVWRFGA